ncbi:hypothetical protein UFOVP1244_77 [uncultured Caudovirales phage]|uniref:Uncharacterized protein n=1 Tax=uncultured Caudovirales phage TaxID=2100421 RepID=A0A6J5RGP2_9CAUD|nr:hypothetical protein UFOVP1244_77 [uncultured Caudovirales phage]
MNGELPEIYLGNGIMISVDSDDEIFLRNMLDDLPCIRMETKTVREFIYFLTERMPWLGHDGAEGSVGTAPSVL